MGPNGSRALLLTDTSILNSPADVGLTTIVTVACAPAFNVPSPHTNRVLQLPWLATADTTVARARARTSTRSAACGPLFATPMR